MSKISASAIIHENITSITEEVDEIVAERQLEAQIEQEIRGAAEQAAYLAEVEADRKIDEILDADADLRSKELFMAEEPRYAGAIGLDSDLVRKQQYTPTDLLNFDM